MVDELNKKLLFVKEKISPMLDFIKSEIFKSKQILTQETVVDKEAHVLANCDLSNEYAVCEIKNSFYYENYFPQLYFQSRGRDVYLLQILSPYTMFASAEDCIIRLIKIDFELY